MQGNRLAELDGLRGIAVLTVILYHYVYRFDQLYGHSFSVSHLFQLGQYGVQLFFIISGFVIYWTISKSEKPLDFIWSRASRLYPSYWAALILTFTITTLYALPGRTAEISTFLINFSMAQEYLDVAHVDGVYWTLTLELTFYFWILMAFCLGQLNNIDKFLLLWVCTSLYLKLNNTGTHIDPKLQKIFLLNYIEFFSAGICFFKLKEKSHTPWTVLLLFTTAVAALVNTSMQNAIIFMAFYIVFSLVIINQASALRNQYLVYLGTISYQLYLIHQNIGYVIIHKSYEWNINPYWGILVSLITSILLSHLLMRFIEKPSMTLLRSYYKNNHLMQSIGRKFVFLSNRQPKPM